MSRDDGRPAQDRRADPRGLRVPFVNRCLLRFEQRPEETAFIVNISIMGAYVARDAMPDLAERVTLRFQRAASAHEVRTDGIVVWLNPSQPHPVHSLPPGFGLQFEDLRPEDQEGIDQIVQEYVARRRSGG